MLEVDDVSSQEQSGVPCWDTPAGLIKGFVHDGIAQASGIRYATAERFQVPIAQPRVTSTIFATTASPACPQAKDLFADAMKAKPLEEVLGFSEDCLRLTVRCPAAGTNTHSKLPVLVWLHGGSYCNGAADAPSYDTSLLVKTESVITVSINYRLGLLGYLDGQDKKPANLGLLDQILALKWIQQNIVAFGGDAHNVTLFGQSAGADAILHLMLIPSAENFFQKAIIQSAPFGVLRQRQEMLAAMRKASHKLSEDASLEDIFKMQEEATITAKKYGLPGYMPFGVQYGVYPLPNEQDLDKAYARVAPKINIMIGHTRREVAAFSCVVPLLRTLLTLPLVSSVVERLVVGKLTRSIYGDGCDKFIQKYKAAGGFGYAYLLDSVSPNKTISAGHCTDLPLLFRNPSDWNKTLFASGISAATLERQATDVKSIWSRFARSGIVVEVNVPGFICIRKI